MANEKHLALLTESLDTWHQWKHNNPHIKPDLSGADLSRSYLNGVNFSEVNLIGANLSRATLSGADLSGATLSGANLSYATLWEANLNGAYLNSANLFKANLSDSYLKGTNFCNANLAKADLNGANLSGADFSGADLNGAQLGRSQALNTNFKKAILTGACLEGWNINTRTNLENVTCEYVYLQVCQQSRNPNKGNFNAGEFIKLFQKVNNTVDLTFANGINWEACAYLLKKMELEHPEWQLEIDSIEKQEDGVLIRINTAAIEEQKKIHAILMQNYEQIHQLWQAQYHVRLNDEISELFYLINQMNEKLGKVIKVAPEKPLPKQSKPETEQKQKTEGKS